MRTAPDEWRPNGIDDLEEVAWAALRDTGNSSVTAGPGAGKTEFLAQRAGYLFETGLCRPPHQILAISFKRDAAVNLRRRVEMRLPDFAGRFTSITFDAFTKSIVDRFHRLLPDPWSLTEGYKIGFTSRAEIETFLTDAAGQAPASLSDEVRALPSSAFQSTILGSALLHAGTPPTPSTGGEFAVQLWWQQHYQGRSTPTLDFTMLNRLAELIIRSSPQVRRAIRATYSFVFVDEFQDTTYAQYSFLHSVFSQTGTSVTVVGDRKQRIMGWAGALSDAFAQFEHDFAASSFTLRSNYRSTQQLVDLQHNFARRLEPSTPAQTSQVAPPVGETPVEVWSFPTAQKEAAAIAQWIALDIESSDRSPGDYALIARQRVADLERTLAPALAEAGLRLRNDDAQVGALKLQDLLKDDIVLLLVGIIRLAANRTGQARTWHEVTRTLERLPVAGRRIREVGTQSEDALAALLASLREWFATASPALGAGTGIAEEAADALTGQLMQFLQERASGSTRLFGDRPEDVETTLASFRVRLTRTLEQIDSWEQAADVFIDSDAVPLLTIHRSKGLEYHTVFFIGLDSDQWWAHSRNPVESTMTFFVGVSRAAERLVFTQCDQRGRPAALGEIYSDLQASGVSIVRFQ